ncbi:MAG TPA: esterase-like activity of phytase family protein, partial [Coleofasciculaceae cyanobacterium]
ALMALGLGLGLGGCGLSQVSAESRLLLPLSAEFVGAFMLPKQRVMDTPVGGLSALAYDRQTDRFLALSDDRANLAPARFYTLKVDWQGPPPADRPGATPPGAESPAGNTLAAITVEQVTFLKEESGEAFRPGTIDPEGLALTPRNTVLIASEGDVTRGIAPWIREFDRTTGVAVRQPLPLPTHYLPGTFPNGEPRGIRDNLGFESLGIVPVGANPSPVEPFRAFVATEANLIQDLEPASPATASATDRPPIPPRSRILHLSLGDGPPFPISEHLYELDASPSNALRNGLVDLTPIDQGGHFLSLERTFDPLNGFGAKLFQVALGTATDTASNDSLRGPLPNVTPAYKRLLLDFHSLGIPIDNLEGLAIGPRLPDGRQSVLIVSDDNFREEQVTQFILLALKGFQSA